MPWSLRKFLSKDNQQSPPNGGDKERAKTEKQSKLGKLRHQFGKRGSDSDVLEQADTISDIDDKTAKQPTKDQTDSRDPSEASLENIAQEQEENTVEPGGRSSSASDIKDKPSQECSRDKSAPINHDFPDFSDDCSNLTSYLESAMLESASNTLDRKGLKNHQCALDDSAKSCYFINPDPEIPGFSQTAQLPTSATEPKAPKSPGSGLCVEYVNYDMLTADSGSNGSSEFYSSDEETATEGKNSNENNNSNSQLDETAWKASQDCTAQNKFEDGPRGVLVTGGQNTEEHGNNIPDSYHRGAPTSGDRSNSDNDHKDLQKERNSSDALKRNGSSGNDDKSSENDQRAIDRYTSCNTGRAGDETKTDNSAAEEPNSAAPNGTPPKLYKEDFMQQKESCPIHHGNEDLADFGSNADMEKARSLFGMCLCQNGEKVDNVTDLDFRNCNLKQVPHDIFQYAQTLTHLQLDSNTLSDLPKSLFSCENLEYLTVSDNDLGSLPPTLAGLSSLKYLDISKNVIEDVPDCIRCCKSLNVLDASVNPIERLSEGFTQLVGLHELYLNDCFLEFLPASFGRLVQLTVLELRDNQLQILPKSIRRLNLLKRLDLGGNIFQEWPDVVCELRKLTELWLDGNELSRVPDELGELTSLVYLDLSRNFIEAIPVQIGSLTELTDLLLCENHITTLPDTIGFLDKLTMLKVSMNQLTDIPESIGKLHAVEELDLSHNKIVAIPPSIGNLQVMHTFLMDNNVLPAIPPELGKCRCLNVLQLSRNLLEEMPREIGDLTELRVFNVCRNRLQYLPITVIKLAQLEALWVSSNQSKPNVPLHAELAPDGKTRILINILFPQTEQDSVKARVKVDEAGYANDAADDDEPPLFPKQRGITRVAFNLEPLLHNADEEDDGDVILTEDEDDNMAVDVPLLPKDQNSNDIRLVNHDEDVRHHVHSVDVSADVISSNGNGLLIQPTSLMVKLPDTSNESIQDNSDMPDGSSATHLPASPGAPVNGGPAHFADGALVSNGDLHDEEMPAAPLPEPNSVAQPTTEVTPPALNTPVDNADSTSPAISAAAAPPAQPPKIKQWSSHSHLPAIPVKDPADAVLPVAVEIINKDDRSSMSSSPSSGPENAADPPVEVRKPEPTRTSKLPIPSRAFLEQTSTSFGKEQPKSEAGNGGKVPAVLTGPSMVDIPFMDSDEDKPLLTKLEKPETTKPKKGAKPPPPPRKDSLLMQTAKPTASTDKILPPKASSVPTAAGKTGYKVFTPALLQNRKSSTNAEQDRLHDPDLLALPGSKPASESSGDGLASTDRDSGVGNDVDSQESIPECPDEQEDLPSPSYRGQPVILDNRTADHTTSPPTTMPQSVRSVASIRVGDSKPPAPPKPDQKVPMYAPIILPTTTQAPPPKAAKPPLPNKVSASIKMFESKMTPENKPQPPAKSLANLLPTGPRKTEEKAIIPPNNHLNGMDEKPGPDYTSTPSTKPPATSSPPVSPVKANDVRDVIMESQPNQVMFSRNDDDFSDAFTFSKVTTSPDATTAPSEPQESPSKKRSRSNSKSKFDESVEAAKQNQFRERLEKIMQQQRSVSLATKAAQNGAAVSLARKSSFNAPHPDDAVGLEKLTAEGSFASGDSQSAGSPEAEAPTKKHVIRDRMKSKLERSQQPVSLNTAAAKSSSTSRLPKPRPGSAPAAQLLQRRGSSQRNSIAAPEGGGYDDRRLAPLCADDRAGLDAKSRSKSIEQQLGQLLLDSDEEHQNYLDRIKYVPKSNNDVIRRDHRTQNIKDQAGFRGSRSSLCSPPPVRHNMYAKARSSNNTASVPLADWKHKLLQHIERKRIEKQQISAIQGAGRARVNQPQQSIGKIKSPPKTSTRHQHQQQPQYYTERDGSNYVTLTQPQPRRDGHTNHRQLSKSVTAPTLSAPTRTMTNTHQYNVEAGPVRSHFAGNSRAAKMAKQRTFTPGPESHGNLQPVAPRPKSAMDKFMTSSPPEPNYAEPPAYRQVPAQQPHYAKDPNFPPTYEDHLHRRAAPYPTQPENHSNPAHRLVRAESSRRSQRTSNRGNYEELAGYPLRQSGSHESLMDPNRYDRQQPFFQNQPIRNASSHDSVLDQPPYPQPQSPQYVPSYYNQKPQPLRNGGYPVNHVPQRYPQAHNAMEGSKRNKYNDYATYVNIYDYDQSPVEYHNQPQMQQNPADLYRSQLGYTQRGGVRGDPRQQQQQQQQRASHAYPKHDPAGNYKNYAHVSPVYQNPRQPPSYDQYRLRESISPTLYRPLAEREEGSVASAFRPYSQTQPIQPQHRTHQSHLHHRHHHHQQQQQQQQQSPYHMHQYGLPPNNVMPQADYKSHRPIPGPSMHHARQGPMMSPPSNYQYLPEQPRHPVARPPDQWVEVPDDVEMVTVTVRRNPTFGFHVMGGVGAGGNPYRPSDDGVFVTHVSPGGAADAKLQAGDKILLVNGSDFVGISHKRAVDLLRNAGQVAVLVVERSLGKPV